MTRDYPVSWTCPTQNCQGVLKRENANVGSCKNCNTSFLKQQIKDVFLWPDVKGM